MDEFITKLKKTKELRKGLRGLNMSGLEEELKRIEKGCADNLYRHPVRLEEGLFGSFEAKTLNKQFNHKGPGDLRYLTMNEQVVGLAKHGNGSGGYQVLFVSEPTYQN